MGGRGTGGSKLPIPIPFNPGARSFLLARASFFAFFFSTAKYYAMLCNYYPFLPLSTTLGILLHVLSFPASRTLPTHFSHFLPPLLPFPHSGFHIKSSMWEGEHLGSRLCEFHSKDYARL